jgi:glycosyltransferase involved in cell wall biosynthesis
VADPEFSLLLPIYAGDKAEYLRRAFRSSVDDQTVKPTEVVLVQDGPVSADLAATLAELVEASPVPANLVVLPENKGLADALDHGMAACRFDVIARMDADDISLPERFEKQLEGIRSGLDLVGTGMFEFADEVGTVIGRRVPPTGQRVIELYSRFHDPFNHPTVMYRRSAVEKAGGYIDVGLMEDYWLFARMIHAGARVENLPEALVMYRVGDGAYARRGGLGQLKAELRLQREFRKIGFTTRLQNLRNVIVRGGYRLVPVGIRRIAYRRLIARGFHS